jgi:hypothetical protein
MSPWVGRTGVCVLALASLAFLAGRGRPGEAAAGQPIAFDHARHAQESLSCDDCHAKADEGPYATFPSLKQCLLCHKEKQGDHPDEPKLREYAEQGQEIPWVTVNRLVGHVYFSHVAHVRFGAMECVECHGDMSQAKEPPQRSQIEGLSMARCMQCHEQRGASLDCIACHK